MLTITTHEAKTHLSRYLARVDAGEEIIIARGKTPIARLSPLTEPPPHTRPKVGETLGDRFAIPDDALAPLSDESLREDWGL